MAMDKSHNLIVIPARLPAKRFPGKLLKKVDGKPLILWTLEQATRCDFADEVWVATDSEEIAELCEPHCPVKMTRQEMPTGSDRIAEVICRSDAKYEFILNWQADEPLVAVDDAKMLFDFMHSHKDIYDMATLAFWDSQGRASFHDRNVVKVVTDSNSKACWFSRAPLPANSERFLTHVGVYCFQHQALRRFRSLMASPASHAESLEQLRLVEWGLRVHVHTTSHASIGVNVPEDLQTFAHRVGKPF